MKLPLEILLLLTREPMSLSEIADELGAERQLVHYHLKSLVNDGWVTRMKSGRSVKYRTNIDKLLEKINPTSLDAITLEIVRARFIERLYMELSIKRNFMNFNEEIPYSKLKLLIYSTLLHAICITDPFYSKNSSIFLRKVGTILAKYIISELESMNLYPLYSETTVKELFEKILDAEIKLIRLRDRILLHFNKFLNIRIFDQRIDDIILAFTETWFSQIIGKAIHVEKYPISNFRRHYSFLIKKIAKET
jgi:DNA-binding MarR family transcriptional regulator